MGGPKKTVEIEQMIARGRFQEAIGSLEQLLEINDRDSRVRFLLAQCYAATNAHQKAIMHARKLLKIGKFPPEATEIKIRQLMAKSLYDNNSLTEAKNEYLILTTLEPDNFMNYYVAGEIFFKSNVITKALKFLQKANQLHSKHPQSLSLIGQCHYQNRAYAEARVALARAVEIKPDLYPAHYYLGLTLRFLNDLEWALKEFDLAQKDEELKPKALLAKGMVLIDQENYSRALTELDKGLRHAVPKSDIALQLHYLMGAANEKSRDIPAAIQSWEILEALKPGYRDVKEKLRQYKEFQTDDKIKDFLICGAAQFEGISRKIIESFGYTISELKMTEDVIIQALCVENESGQRNTRRNYCYFHIQREMTPVREEAIRTFHEKMREQNASRGYIITTSEFAPTAREFASSRAIELIDSQALADLIKKAVRQ